jgi:hypothetical protein
MSRLAKPFLGRWRIVHMDQWDRDFLDLLEPAFITFDDGGLGAFVFGAVNGQLDCRYGEIGVDFTWQGHDDADEACGRGHASLSQDGSLEGHLFFHLGDDSAFKAIRD